MPSPADTSLLSTVTEVAMQYEVDDILLLGDFNLVPCSNLDRLHPSSRWSLVLAQWATNFALVDVWRQFHPSSWELTCHSASYQTLPQIDLAFASGSALHQVSAISILSRGVSDHAPLLVILSLGLPGGGLWRLSRYWVIENSVQEPMQEELCQYWLTNYDCCSYSSLRCLQGLVTWQVCVPLFHSSEGFCEISGGVRAGCLT